MANLQTQGYGCKAIEVLGNGPATQGQSKYRILSGLGVRILKNEPIGPQDSSGDDGYMQSLAPATMDDTGTGGASWDADTTTPEVCVGVSNGVFYIDGTTSKPTWSNSVAASQTFATNPNTGNSDGYVFVNDNPFQEYMMRTDATMTNLATFQSDCLVVRMNQNNGGAGVSGQSTATLNYSTSDNDGYMWRMIRLAEVPDQEDVTAAGCDVVVVMNNRANQFLRDA
jgi:hypothetical protein|tara:strand:- start:312 stop:989 length:678 start_codon:yes stop_codon:yes gene_type:complete